MKQDNRPDWWPQNPYPKEVFTMTRMDYVEAIPDGVLRTAVSGCLGRLFWDMASDLIHEAWTKQLDLESMRIMDADRSMLSTRARSVLHRIRDKPISWLCAENLATVRACGNAATNEILRWVEGLPGNSPTV